ncbi:MAG: AMP-binding protein [Myxococcota bacterium]
MSEEREANVLFPGWAKSTGQSQLGLIVGNSEYTWSELHRAVEAHATVIRERCRPGERVAVWTDRTPATPIALLANAIAEVVSVPLNPALGTREREHILGDASPRLIVSPDSAHMAERGAIPVETAPSSEAVRPPLPADDAPLLLLYTSGTTGAPKGAVLSRGNVAANLEGLAAAWQWTANDIVVHALPLFHVHGLVLGWFGSVSRGGALHWVPRFDPGALARALVRHGDRAVLFAVPTMYHRLIESDDPAVATGLECARLLVSGSAGLPLRDQARLEALTGRPVIERYGLTETLINCAVRAGHPTPGRVGPPVDRVELRLVDDQREPTVPSDGQTMGEVAVRGPSVFQGYLHRPEATAAVLDEHGWFYTGDLATQDPDGAIRIVGRKSTDLIKTGGFKVGAGEVESALLEHRAVAEAAVVGVADPDLGQRIEAFVVCRGGAQASEDTLREHVASLLSPHKRPRRFHFVSNLPRNAMGKVQKRRLLTEPPAAGTGGPDLSSEP